MLTADFQDISVSRKVSERAAQLAATAYGLRYGYLDTLRMVDIADPGQALQLWRVDATYGQGRDARHVEVSGGFHPTTAPLQLGPATASCSCPDHTFRRRICKHIVATWRRAVADHVSALEQVPA